MISTGLRVSDSSLGTTTASTAATLSSLAPIDITQTIAFLSVYDAFKTIDNFDGDSCTFRNFSIQNFQDMDSERDKRGRRIRFFYLADVSTLIVTIPRGIHEIIHREIFFQVRLEIAKMGLINKFATKGAATFQKDNSSGEGDSSGGPRPERGSEYAWPTFIVEAGWTQSWQSLKMKMSWWFSASAGEVKIVLLVRFEPAQARIVLQKWTLGGPRPGATRTRATAQNQPRQDQLITIRRYREPDDSVSYTADKQLRLEFKLLFLRDPVAGETDIIISKEQLQEYAEALWEAYVPNSQ